MVHSDAGKGACYNFLMNQKLVIVRGTACTGKTTICKEIRDFDKKIAWVSIDKIKNIYSDYEDRAMDEVNDTAVFTIKHLIDKNYSVIVDGIFKNIKHYEDIVKLALPKNIPVVTYQLECSLETLKIRDKERDGVKQGLWAPMGDELIESLYKKVVENPIKGVIRIDTEEKSIDDCVQIIRLSF